MNVSIARAKKLARSLLRENQRGRTWRTIARDDYQNQIDQSTLSRIARKKGEWIPVSLDLQVILGLKKPCEPKLPPPPLPEWKKKIKKQIALMAKETRQELGL